MHTIELRPLIFAKLSIQAETADALSRSDVEKLMTWCDWQPEELWNGLCLQEILNVYRISAEYDTFVGFSEEEPQDAVSAYNRAVLPQNRFANVRVA